MHPATTAIYTLSLHDALPISGSAVPSIANQVGGSHRDQGHGCQAGPLGLPHAALRHEIHGPRSRLLPTQTPRITGPAAQVESRQAGIQSHPNPGSGLRTKSFCGEGSVRPRIVVLLCFSGFLPMASGQSEKPTAPGPLVARVADTGFVQVRAESFDALTPQQKALAYWLTQASIAMDPI